MSGRPSGDGGEGERQSSTVTDTEDREEEEEFVGRSVVEKSCALGLVETF